MPKLTAIVLVLLTSITAKGERDAADSDNIISLQIVVTSPFWQTWWFYTLLALIVAGLLYRLDKERLRRKEAVHLMRQEIAANLHRKINTALSNINILSEIAKIKADRDLEKSKEYIDQIHQKSHRIMIDMDDVLWSIDPANDSMEKTIMRMREYADALQNRHGIDMKLEVANNVKKIKLDMKTRNEFFLFYKYAVRVPVEYANAKKVSVNIECVKNLLTLSVQTKGLSYDEEDSRGEVIIQKIKDKAERMKAAVDVVADFHDCSILLQIPLK